LYTDEKEGPRARVQKGAFVPDSEAILVRTAAPGQEVRLYELPKTWQRRVGDAMVCSALALVTLEVHAEQRTLAFSRVAHRTALRFLRTFESFQKATDEMQ
jgi:MoxR-like ATPase